MPETTETAEIPKPSLELTIHETEGDHQVELVTVALGMEPVVLVRLDEPEDPSDDQAPTNFRIDSSGVRPELLIELFEVLLGGLRQMEADLAALAEPVEEVTYPELQDDAADDAADEEESSEPTKPQSLPMSDGPGGWSDHEADD
jgi:hypothetical protein